MLNPITSLKLQLRFKHPSTPQPSFHPPPKANSSCLAWQQRSFGVSGGAAAWLSAGSLFMTGETGLQRRPRGWRWGGGQGKENSERTRVRRVGTLVVGWENTSLSASDGSPPTAALFSCCPTGPQPDDRKVLSSVCLSEAAPPCSHGTSIPSLPGRQPLPPFPLSLLLLSRLEGWFEVAPKYPIPDPNQPPS